jgi:two-component system, NtrC family, sensor kinase
MTLPRTVRLAWIYEVYHLAQCGTALASGDAVYQKILLHIVEAFGAQSGCLALTTEDGVRLRIVAGIDLPAGVVGSEIQMGADVLGFAARSNTPLLLNGDLSNDSRFPHKPQRTETGTPHSAICWPLRTDNAVIGAISVNRGLQEPVFSQSDVEHGTLILNLISLVLGNIRLHRDQQRRIEELKNANRLLAQAQSQLVQSEKLASIGQLAAGVAHEINNPIGFVSSNLGSLQKYLDGVFAMLQVYEGAEATLAPEVRARLNAIRQGIDLGFLKADIPMLMEESREGIARVKTIVQSLKEFSHADAGDEWQLADLHKGLERTIKVAWNELKYKAEVIREYGDIPPIECLPHQLDQVFLNILVNAAHAINDVPQNARGAVTVRTEHIGERVTISISDTGCGIQPENLSRIFDPFFTTKKIGKGTGLGLSVSYGIVRKHHGRIDVVSEPGKGSTFTISLPIRAALAVPAVTCSTIGETDT